MAKKHNSPKIDRSEKLAELRHIVERLQERIEMFGEQGEQRALLVSVAKGLYDETDKLTKKAPSEQVTELLLQQVNQVIAETKELIEQDAYVQRLNQFVSAGDNPEHRDVVVILRMVLQGLERFAPALQKEVQETKRSLREARVLEYVTDQFQTTGEVLTKDEIDEDFVKAADAWFVGDEEAFDFDDLDKRDLKEYFEVE